MVSYKADPAKAASNLRKHGIDFDEAVKVFDDPWVMLRQDRIVEGEVRWQAIGVVDGCAVLLVAHTHEEAGGDEIIRLISARKADRKERRTYEQHRIGVSN